MSRLIGWLTALMDMELRNMDTIPKGWRESRLKVCRECHALDGEGFLAICSERGDFVDIKTRLLLEKCPNNYWPRRAEWLMRSES